MTSIFAVSVFSKKLHFPQLFQIDLFVFYHVKTLSMNGLRDNTCVTDGVEIIVQGMKVPTFIHVSFCSLSYFLSSFTGEIVRLKTISNGEN